MKSQFLPADRAGGFRNDGCSVEQLTRPLLVHMCELVRLSAVLSGVKAAATLLGSSRYVKVKPLLLFTASHFVFNPYSRLQLVWLLGNSSPADSRYTFCWMLAQLTGTSRKHNE